jgi:hypothetical protein
MKNPNQYKKPDDFGSKRGKIKRVENNWNMVRKTLLSSLFLSIPQQSWTKLMYLVQKRYTPSPAREVQK